MYCCTDKSDLKLTRVAWFLNLTDALDYADKFMEDLYYANFKAEVFVFDEEHTRKTYRIFNYEPDQEEG